LKWENECGLRKQLEEEGERRGDFLPKERNALWTTKGGRKELTGERGTYNTTEGPDLPIMNCRGRAALPNSLP